MKVALQTGILLGRFSPRSVYHTETFLFLRLSSFSTRLRRLFGSVMFNRVSRYESCTTLSVFFIELNNDKWASLIGCVDISQLAVKLAWRLSRFGMKADEQACYTLGYIVCC